MKKFTQTLLNTDGQTLVDFILFLQYVDRAPNEDTLNWFLWRRETNDPKTRLSQKSKGGK
jgi:hypothetical protein